jgi:hypothetical protein
MTSTRALFVEAAVGALGLVAAPEVGRRWDEPSALPAMAVGALAAHLARQVHRVPEVLALPVPDERPVTLIEHYTRSPWVTAGVDDEPNVATRDRAAQEAAAGQDEVLRHAREALAVARRALPDEPADRVVRVPWTGWSLTLDDYLRSRLVEIVVHGDDLACSVGVEPPDWPDEVAAPVLGVLTTLAVRRHGLPAVLRTLSRAERAPGNVSAF